jgi:ABC-2 type transport system permease protein
LQQVAWLGRRSLVFVLRQPVMIIPSIFFPLAFLVVIAAGGERAASIPGFPADSYLSFALGGAFVQGTMLAGINSGTKLAYDIETGFLDRLVLTPVSSSAILIGHVIGSLAVAMIQLSVFLVAGLIGGVRIVTGPGGVVVMFALALAVAVAFSAFGAIVGVRTGSSEKVQGVFPLFFIMLIFSSYMLPRNLMEADWFRWFATVNPASYLIEGVRSLVTIGWDAGALIRGFGAAAGIAVLTIAGASRTLRRKAVWS